MNIRPKQIAKALLLILLLVLIILFGLLAEQYFEIRNQGIINTEKLQLQNLASQKPLNAADVIYIEPWMTFNYINISFKLPNNYLKNALHISNPKYPNIVIVKYAKSIGKTGTIFTNTVRAAVRQYFSSKT